MATRRRTEPEAPASPRRRATTPEGRENQLITLAVDLAEQQLRRGTASAQVSSHYLKLGSTREHLEQQRLEHENELLKAKTGALAATSRIEELIANAITAMRSYTGQEVPPDGDHYED